MAQGFMAGFTTYENQSLSDIVEDIGNWIDYSEKTIEFFENTIDEIKNTAFYNKISYDYKSFMYEAIQICRTNIEDFKQVLNAIEQNQLTSEKVDLFFKIGKRAVSNSEENKCSGVTSPLLLSLLSSIAFSITFFNSGVYNKNSLFLVPFPIISIICFLKLLYVKLYLESDGRAVSNVVRDDGSIKNFIDSMCSCNC